MDQVSAYIPTYNNRSTVKEAIRSLLDQSAPISELILIDDGSDDGTPDLAAEFKDIQIIRHPSNLGRGAARHTAMSVASNEFVLCCDATNRLAPDFLLKAKGWMQNESVAAVYGWLKDPAPHSASDRWRARYLFRQDHRIEAEERQDLITWGTLVRRSAVMKAGNYDKTMRHSEDADLGKRLISGGHKIYADPALEVHPLISNPPAKVIERYLRWNFGPNGNSSLKSRMKFARYASSCLLKNDLSLRDWGAAAISVLCILKAFKRYER